MLGSLRGGTVIHIRGAHLDHDTAICRFASIEVEASLVSEASQITCVSPPVTEGDVTVEVAGQWRGLRGRSREVPRRGPAPYSTFHLDRCSRVPSAVSSSRAGALSMEMA